MTLNIPIPDSIAQTLRAKLGPQFEQRTREDLAIEWYRQGLITSGQFAEMMNLAWVEAQALLKNRNIGQSLSIDEIAEDAERLRVLRQG